ncbi:hypothetical protein L1987_57400 [Smallanthus sonchifolius]|uniref:Uncharacterized protein n=1 Tax=Smallanthus sonchifolius TaxID=185202 RepID=A0ACB9DCX2_9ASTR|nr:hypothetical protein L1987_57400 [Smallanthus sonchifolius]
MLLVRDIPIWMIKFVWGLDELIWGFHSALSSTHHPPSLVRRASTSGGYRPLCCSDVSAKEDICAHPGVIGGMCIKCGEKMDNQSGIAFGYIHKDLRLANDEIVRLRDRDLKNLFSHKKRFLI